ncbi:MAG: hypothetical protein HY717_13555 [Planctomycetes bacterium]|nr:hypothetical protein [Planctomycetota bacterium]
MACPAPRRAEGEPRLSGRLRLRLAEGSRLAQIYGRLEVEEAFTCNFEINPAYLARLVESGLRPAAFSERGEARAVEIPGHRFFIATLFLPQLASRHGRPHPLLTAFLQAAGRGIEEGYP